MCFYIGFTGSSGTQLLQTILNKMASIYGRLQDIEELYKDSAEVEAIDQNGNKVKIITRG